MRKEIREAFVTLLMAFSLKLGYTCIGRPSGVQWGRANSVDRRF
jgi:hypothetical protein